MGNNLSFLLHGVDEMSHLNPPTPHPHPAPISSPPPSPTSTSLRGFPSAVVIATGQKSVEMKHKASCGGDSGSSARDSSGGLLAEPTAPERIRRSSRDAGCQFNPAHAATATTATLSYIAFRLTV